MKMTRGIVAGAVIVSLLVPSAATAGGPVLSSATRIAQEAVRKDPSVLRAAPQKEQLAQDGGFFANPERSRRTKLLIGVGAAAAFVGSIWAIARNSEDVTPSTLGTRQDGCCFK